MRDEQDKNLFLDKKAQVQQQIRSQMGLLIDCPKPGGSGTSNDENISKRFFQNLSLSSSLSGAYGKLNRLMNLF